MSKFFSSKGIGRLEQKRADKRLGSQHHLSYSHTSKIGALFDIENAPFNDSKYAQSIHLQWIQRCSQQPTMAFENTFYKFPIPI